MSRVPRLLAVALAAGVAFVSLTACSSSSPSTDKTTTKTPGTPGSTADTAKLKKIKKGKGIQNQYATLASGAKISLSAASPGHDVVAQVRAKGDKKWSKPVTVFSDDNRFCHAIRVSSAGGIAAATVTCGLTAQESNGTETSYVLATTDGTTWKRADLKGAETKPLLSPTGKYAAWQGPESFLIWSPTPGTFKSIHVTQSADSPTGAVLFDTGSLLLVKAAPSGKKDCIVTFQTASVTAPTLHTINSTLPQSDKPKCAMVNVSFKPSSPDLLANLTTQSRVVVNGKKVTKTTTFAWEFAKNTDGHWYIKP